MIPPYACSHETKRLNHGLPIHQPGSCDLTYVTLRAFLLSLDGLLRYSLEPSKSERTGSDLLHFYPPLAGMAPQIQMETVLRTWNRWTHSNHASPSPLEARILFAATELLASLATDRQNPCCEWSLRVPEMCIT